MTVSLEPLGLGGSVTVSVPVPLGCDTDSHDRDECAPQEEFTTGAPDEGNVDAIYADECDPKEQTRSNCKASLVDVPVAIPIPQQIVDAAEELEETVEGIIGMLPDWVADNLPDGIAPPGMPTIENNQLVFHFVGVNFCGPDPENTTQYPCGSKKTDVRTCD